MDRRRLRLGDILDDYCPRERRVTNHAVVAMVEDDVKQTRCTTCDAEHVYKGGKAPRRKKSESTGALYKEVLAGITDEPAAAPAPTSMSEHHDPVDTPPVEDIVDTASDAVATAPEEEPVEEPEEAGNAAPPIDDGPVHRPLIRAQLPRPEGVKAERQAPDFTIRHSGGRGNGNFRGDMRGRSGRGGGNNNSHRFGRGGNQRFDRGRKRGR